MTNSPVVSFRSSLAWAQPGRVRDMKNAGRGRSWPTLSLGTLGAVLSAAGRGGRGPARGGPARPPPGRPAGGEGGAGWGRKPPGAPETPPRRVLKTPKPPRPPPPPPPQSPP